MALDFATGTLNIGTGAATTQYSITGKTPASGGPWKAVILWTAGRPETTDAAAEEDIQPGFGAAVSTSSRWAITAQSDHTPTTTASDRYQTDAACLAVLDIAGAVVGLLDFVSFNADGATFVVDNDFPAAVEVSYILLGGADLTNAETGLFQLAIATGDTDYTSETSFLPDFAIFASSIGNATPPATNTNHQLSIGAATATAQAVLATISADAQATSVCASYCRAGEILAEPFGIPGTTRRCSLTSFLSTGFRINKLEGAAQCQIFYLALKGGTYALGNFLTATDTTAFSVAHGMSMTPKGAMLLSANRAASTQDAATAHLEWSVGASDGSNNNCQYVRDKDASANADCFRAVSHDQCYYNADSATSQAMEGEGHVNSFDATNINFQMADADPAQSFIWYINFADTVAAGVNLMGQACL